MSDTIDAPPETGYGVTLYVCEPEATSAIGAVESLLERILSQGLRRFAYAVEDLASGELFIVDDFEVFTQESYLAKQEASGDGSD